MAHARSESRRRESKVFEGAREKGVLLEAVAAPSAGDQLRLQARQIEPDRNAEQDVEILERDRCRMRAMQRVECCPRRRKLARVADPPQVRRKIERNAARGIIHLHLNCTGARLNRLARAASTPS